MTDTCCTGIYNPVALHLADPTGVVNSSAGIQATIDECGIAGGGIVLLPPGQYWASGLTIDYPNITLAGLGPGSTKLGFFDGDGTLGGSNGEVILTVNDDNFTVLDLTLSNGPAIDIGVDAGNDFSTWGSTLWAEGVDGLMFNRVHFIECGGIRGVGIRDSSNITIDECLVENISRTGMVILDTCDNVRVTNSTFRNVLRDEPGQNSYLLAASYSGTLADNPDHLYFVRGFLVDGCTFENNPSWEGIDCHGGEDVRITNNKVTGCRIGISMQSASSSGIAVVVDNVMKRLVIANNTIERGDAGTSLYGINVAGSSAGDASNNYFMEDVVIHGNIIKGMGGTASEFGGAIHIKRCYDANIFGNTIEEFAQFGIIIDDSSANIIMANNVIRDAGTEHFNSSGVAPIAMIPSNNLRCTDNTLVNTTDNISFWYYSKQHWKPGSSVTVEGTKFIHTGSVFPPLQSTAESTGWHIAPFNVADFGVNYSAGSYPGAVSGDLPGEQAARQALNSAKNSELIQYAIDLAEDVASEGRGAEVFFPLPVVAHDGVTLTSSSVLLSGPGIPLDIAGGKARDMAGSGSPEGAVTAPLGTKWSNTSGGAGTSLYVKETAPTPNTGWEGAASLSAVPTESATTISLESYLDKNAKFTEQRIHGGIDLITSGETISTGDDIVVVKGTGKLFIVVNAGTDLTGTITVTGTSVDRNTGVQTPADPSTMTIAGLTTDSTSTDANGVTVHGFTSAYISDRWYTGSVTLSTTDVDLSDVDVYSISFEQGNDIAMFTANTFDITAKPTNANAWLSAHLYSVTVNSSVLDVASIADLVESPLMNANQLYRLRRGQLGVDMDGSKDGLYVSITLGPSNQTYWEDVTTKVWLTAQIPL